MGIGNNSWGKGKPDPDKGKGGIGNSAWSNRKANGKDNSKDGKNT